MKIWLIFDLKDEAKLDALDSAINKDLNKAQSDEKIRTYLGNPDQFTDTRYHPTKPLATKCFNVHKVKEWTPYMLKRINESKSELVELTEDWFVKKDEN